MSVPRVSILMAVYNAEPYLAEAVDSVLAQTESAWELLCVDDASTDGSLAILEQYASRDARIRVFPQTGNRGLSVVRNVALRAARGQWVMILDADDWLSPSTLSLALEKENDAVDAIVLQLVHHFPGREPQVHGAMCSLMTGRQAFLLSLDWTLHGLMLVRRELHLRYPYDERLRWYADDNTVRLHYLHSRQVVFSQGEYHYRRHPESNTMAVSAQRFLHLRANLQMAETLCQENVDAAVRRRYETIRWQNYVAMLRLYHQHSASFSPVDGQWIKKEFRSIYPTFHRPLPYCLFVLRQWLGCLWQKGRSSASSRV